MVNGISKAFYLGLLTVCLTACGGGGSSGDEGYTGAGLIRVTITTDKTTLAVNQFGLGPNPAGPYTNTITVRAERPDGTLYPAPSVTVDLTPSTATGALYYLDGDPEHVEEITNPDGTKTKIPKAYRRLAFEDTSGIVTAHFHATGGGSVTLVASVADPNTGQSISSSIQISVGAGVSTGKAAQILFQGSADPLYITGQGRPDIKTLQIFVLDDAGAGVPNPSGNNLRLQLLAGRPNGGEKLVTRDAGGSAQEGTETPVNTVTVNGVAQVALHSGSLPGTVRIAAIADRADNNVDNGIQAAVTEVFTVPIGSGEIVSLTFTGRYPAAVAARRNTLGLDAADSLRNGVYYRDITVVAVDEFGNPPPAGQPVNFYLMDSPMTGYPSEGRGTFTITGSDGNPQEGGNTFATQTSSLAGARVNCLLVIEGQAPDQLGGRLISGVGGANLLSVYDPFNQTLDTGFKVPYTVGCPPHAGNVQNVPGGLMVLTDENGIASTVMNYPITQLGRNFKLVAEANGGKAGAVLSHWYMGVPDGSTLSINPPGDTAFTVQVGQAGSKVVTLQLADVNKSPLPAERIAVEIVITDPDEAAAIKAEEQVKVEEAALAALGTKPDDCDDQEPEDKALCEAFATQEEELNKAKQAASRARTLADLHTPKACATANLQVTDVNAAECAREPVLITGADGQVQVKLLVSDLSSTSPSKVEFFFNTVGPEIRSTTQKVTVTPGTGPGS
jgi:hypothetical protein